MYKVYKWDKLIASFENWDDVMRFVGYCALEDNCGIFRHWVMDGATYFDCGPNTYKAVEEN